MVCLRVVAEAIGSSVGAGMNGRVVVVVRVDRVMVGWVIVDPMVSVGGFCELKSVRLLKSSRRGVDR
jgi:hypothetical protein